MKRIWIAALAAILLFCSASHSLAEAEPSDTVPPKEASSVDFLFGMDIDAVNLSVRNLMDAIASPSGFFAYFMTAWPGANGEREPEWEDFSPTRPDYNPSMSLGVEYDAEDENGNLRYILELMDFSFEDWIVEVINGGDAMPCVYEKTYFISDWIPAEEMDLQIVTLTRYLASNVKTKHHIKLPELSVQAAVYWEDEDYAVTWIWDYAKGWPGVENANMLKLYWKALDKAVYAVYDANEGWVLNSMTRLPGGLEEDITTN